MPNINRLLFTLVAAAAIGSVSLLAQGSAIDIIFVAKPQFAGNSCRSYALALAVGTLAGSPLPIRSVSELRASERDLQARLESTAKAMGAPNTAGSHVVWKRAVEEMTSGAVEAIVEYAPTAEAFYTRVAAITGRSDADGFGPLLSSAIVTAPVMTSVTSVGANTYSPSHIVTLFGVGGARANASTPRALAMLNPAVKVASVEQRICDMDTIKDERWSAVVSLESAYSLTRFPSGYLVMWLRKR